MGALDTILDNYKNSQLGQTLDGLPSDDRTPEQKVQDMVASDPNTPANATPITQPIAPAQVAAVPGLGGNPVAQPVAPAPQAAPFVPATAQTQAPNIADSYKAAAGAAQQIQNALPHAGIDQAKGALANLGNIQSEGAANQANLAGKEADTYGNLQDELGINQITRENQTQPILDKIDSVNNEIANSKIDPNRYWSNQTTGNKILTGIGLALSAFGGPEAVAKTNNIIQGAVDRDIASQKHDYEVKKQNRDNLVSSYSMLRNQGLDEDQATIGAAQIGLNQIKSQMQQTADNTQSAAAKQNAKLAIADIQQRMDANAGQLTQAIAAKANTVKVGDTLPDNYASIMPADQRAKYIPDVGLALTDKGAEEVAKQYGKISVLNNAFNRVQSLRSVQGALTPGTPAHAELVEAGNALTDAMRQQDDLKRISPDAMDFIKSKVADPTGWQVSTLDRLANQQRAMNQDFASTVKPYIANYSNKFSQTLRGGK